MKAECVNGSAHGAAGEAGADDTVSLAATLVPLLDTGGLWSGYSGGLGYNGGLGYSGGPG